MTADRNNGLHCTVIYTSRFYGEWFWTLRAFFHYLSSEPCQEERVQNVVYMVKKSHLKVTSEFALLPTVPVLVVPAMTTSSRTKITFECNTSTKKEGHGGEIFYKIQPHQPLRPQH